ncbi:MAG: hypothetical protein VX019_01620, partial [Pseudomonadota bacterium]|nr:hypothetical protein [Pseudomonadota bacterium]
MPLKKAGLQGATHFQKSSKDGPNIAILTAQASRLFHSGIYTQPSISKRAGHWRITAGEFQI